MATWIAASPAAIRNDEINALNDWMMLGLKSEAQPTPNPEEGPHLIQIGYNETLKQLGSVKG